MNIAWLRKTYRVPARRGGRIEYSGNGRAELGTICGASGGHLSVRLDGARHSSPFHPTWKIRYLDGSLWCRPVAEFDDGRFEPVAK